MNYYSERPYEFFDAENIISGKYHLPYEKDRSEIKIKFPENDEELEEFHF